jgi:heme exporter protein C
MMTILKYLLGIWMVFIIYSGFIWPIPEIQGLGQMARIIYFHVPMSWIATVAFAMAMIYGIAYLRTRKIEHDIHAEISAELGLVFSILATVTGSIWAKNTWGSYWNWDPRETSIFILMLIYGAYFALRSAIDNPERKAALSAVYVILAFVTVPFFMFVMPRIMPSLHPGSEQAGPLVNAQGKLHMDGRMLAVFFPSLAAFTLLFFWIFSLRVKVALFAFKKQNQELR